MNLNYYPIDQCDMFLYIKLQKEVLLLKDEYLRKIALDDIFRNLLNQNLDI